MALFCPTCSNLLLLDDYGSGDNPGLHYRCPTCPYVVPLKFKIGTVVVLPKKKIEECLDEDDELNEGKKTQAPCPACSHNEAYYEEFQTRSADEPMTLFLKCTACKFRWHEY